MHGAKDVAGLAIFLVDQYHRCILAGLQRIDTTELRQDFVGGCRFCAAARAALLRAVPRHPGFLELALQHQYPLRHLDTVELPYCDLGSYLAKVQGADMAYLAAGTSDPTIGCCYQGCSKC
jgi:hypothetical protein